MESRHDMPAPMRISIKLISITPMGCPHGRPLLITYAEALGPIAAAHVLTTPWSVPLTDSRSCACACTGHGDPCGGFLCTFDNECGITLHSVVLVCASWDKTFSTDCWVHTRHRTHVRFVQVQAAIIIRGQRFRSGRSSAQNKWGGVH